MFYQRRMLSIGIIFHSLLLHSQQTNQSRNEGKNQYFVSYTDKVTITTKLDTHLQAYDYNPGGGDKLELVTNNDFKISFGVNYKIISFGFSFAPSFLPGNGDDDLKGDSSYKEFSLNLFPGSWVQHMSYQKTAGFYVKNTNDFVPGLGTYFRFPDLNVTTFEGRTGYVMNPTFSMKNILNQGEWQWLSSGSFVPSLHYCLEKFKNEFGGLPDLEAFTTKENVITIELEASYFYTHVINKHWYISPAVKAAAGPRFSSYKHVEEQNTVKEKSNVLTFLIGGGIQLAYNKDRFALGINSTLNKRWYEDEDKVTVIKDSWDGAVYFAYRFDMPNSIKSKLKWMDGLGDNRKYKD